MKVFKIGIVTPGLIDGHLIISLDQKWINVFGEIPKFTAIIDDKGRLILQSQSFSRKADFANEFRK